MNNDTELELLELARKQEQREKRKEFAAATVFLPFLVFGLIVFITVLSLAR